VESPSVPFRKLGGGASAFLSDLSFLFRRREFYSCFFFSDRLDPTYVSFGSLAFHHSPPCYFVVDLPGLWGWDSSPILDIPHNNKCPVGISPPPIREAKTGLSASPAKCLLALFPRRGFPPTVSTVVPAPVQAHLKAFPRSHRELSSCTLLATASGFLSLRGVLTAVRAFSTQVSPLRCLFYVLLAFYVALRKQSSFFFSWPFPLFARLLLSFRVWSVPRPFRRKNILRFSPLESLSIPFSHEFTLFSLFF